MNNIGLCVPMLLVLAAPTSADTPPKTAWLSAANSTQLAEICRETDSPTRADYCTGYILAAYDQLSLAGAVCPKPGSGTAQVSAIGRKAILDHPENWHRHPAAILRDRFREVFPCG